MSEGLPEGLLPEIRQRLADGRPVRRGLPGSGRLHVDRQLPFLVAYRRPPDRKDRGTRRLIVSQASYLALSGAEEHHEAAAEVARTVVETLAPVFGAFLLVEIWTAPAASDADGGEIVRVVTPDPQGSLQAVDVLCGAIEELEIGYWRPDVRQVRGKTAAPPGLPPLLGAEVANRVGCWSVGVEIDPAMFRDGDGRLYPELVRELTVGLSGALQRAFFAFLESKTSIHLPAWQGLGRRATVRAVGRVDRALADVCGTFDFLLAVTPVDAAEAWETFRGSGYDEPPSFRYRPLATDAERLLRQLYAVPLEEVEDPTLERLFREKVREVARQLTMLAERNTHRFLPGSVQLYGDVETELRVFADRLLSTLPDESFDQSRDVGADDFAALARREIAEYRRRNADFTGDVEIRDDVSGLLVSKGTLLVDRSLRLKPTRAEALLQHEVGTHVFTWATGSRQPLEIFRDGLAGYEETQEGLAVLAEYLTGGLSAGRLRLLAARVIAVDRVVRGRGFVEIFTELVEAYGVAPGTAFTATMRVTRGGGLTKDAVYLRGFHRLVQYLRDGGRLEPLLVGKVSLRHVPVVEELLYREVLRPPELEPAWTQRPDGIERLARLRKGVPIETMIQETA